MNNSVILLVEDDFINRRQTKKNLQEKGYQILEAKNVPEAIKLLKTESIHLAILDINLGENEENGITLGNQLYEKYNIPFIYLTAYDTESFVESAISTYPYAYLTKPYKNLDLINSVELALKQSAHKAKHIAKILVKDEDHQINLPIQSINYLESDGNYILINTSNKTYKTRSTIKQILEKLPSQIFVQVHRAYIINYQKIEKYSSSSVFIAGREIPVSKVFKDFIRQET